MPSTDRVRQTRRHEEQYPSDDENPESLERRKRRFQKSYITSAAASRKAARQPAPTDEDGECDEAPRPKRSFFRVPKMDLSRLTALPTLELNGQYMNGMTPPGSSRANGAGHAHAHGEMEGAAGGAHGVNGGVAEEWRQSVRA